jgi:hypothetical protein
VGSVIAVGHFRLASADDHGFKTPKATGGERLDAGCRAGGPHVRRENWRGGSGILDAWCRVGGARVPQISICNHVVVRFSADLMAPPFRPSRFFLSFSFERASVRLEVSSARARPSPDGSCPGFVWVQGGAGTDVDPP